MKVCLERRKEEGSNYGLPTLNEDLVNDVCLAMAVYQSTSSMSEDANNQHQNEKSPTATPSIRILGLLLIQNKNGTTKGILNVWGQEWM